MLNSTTVNNDTTEHQIRFTASLLFTLAIRKPYL